MLDTLHWARPARTETASADVSGIVDGRRCTVQLANGYLYLDAAASPAHALLGHDALPDANPEDAPGLLDGLAPGFSCVALTDDVAAAAARARRLLHGAGFDGADIALAEASLGEPARSARGVIALENDTAGRSGAWFASLAWGRMPDAIVVGEALSGGVPFGAVLARAGTLGPPRPEPDAGASEAALARVAGTIAAVLGQGLVALAPSLDAYLQSRLRSVEATCPEIERIDVLPFGARLTVRAGGGAALKRRLCERGVLVGLDARGRIVIAPPLVVRPAEIDVIAGTLRAALGGTPTWRLPVCCPACEGAGATA